MDDGMSKVPMTKFKKKHFKPKNQKSKSLRANEPLLSVFMWGIDHTIKELNHVNIPIVLLPDDFKASLKIKKDNYLYQRDTMPLNFKIKEYCPLVFRNLRERFSIYDSDYLKSLTKLQPVAVDRLSSGSGTPSKFYLSFDNQFILKKLSSDEVEKLHQSLNEYHAHIVERHGKTLLPKFLGMYRLTVENQVTYILVMRNIFDSSLPIHKKYDLKGFNPDREANEEERGKGLPCLKENDFIKDGTKLHLDFHAKSNLISTLEVDTAFLARENLIDYSLCLGVHDCNRCYQELTDVKSFRSTSLNDDANNITEVSFRKFRDQGDVKQIEKDVMTDISIITSSEPAKQVYFLGLVDILTQFRSRGRIVFDPDQYRKKFTEFIAKAIVSSPE